MQTARLLRPLLAVASLAGLVIFAAATAGSAAATAANSAAGRADVAPASRGRDVHTHPDIFVSGASTTGSTSHSNNWAGYAALPRHSRSSFRYVQATFTVPSVNCAATVNAFSVHWVGLDGFDNSTVQQDGIEADCNGTTPVYTAWWETYPANQIQTVSSVNVSPGDAVTASVYYNTAAGAHHDRYNFILTDVSNGQSFNLWERCGGPTCKNSSAEVISEAPSSASVLPLADFGIISLVNVHVTDKSRQRGGIRSSHWKHNKIILVGGSASHRTLATPGSLFGSHAFSNTWKHAS
jgi:Peptidase A4 family